MAVDVVVPRVLGLHEHCRVTLRALNTPAHSMPVPEHVT